MTKDHTQPPAAWRYCGNQLKLWRTHACGTREDLARETNYGVEAIGSMEQGRRKPTRRVLDIADELYGAGGKLRAASGYLEPEKFPARTEEFMEAEAAAIALHWYETMLVPGLLQTEEYARALLNAHCPPLDDETIEERLAARMERQEILRARPRTQFTYVIHEAAIRNVVGSPAQMRKQLENLTSVGELRNATVQILPFGSGAHAGLNGPLVLVETEDHHHYAYVEGQETGALCSEPEKVSSLTQRHILIRALALTPEDSTRFIGKVAEEL